ERERWRLPVFLNVRGRVEQLFADGEIGLGRRAAEAIRSVLATQPSADKKVVRRWARPGDARDGNVTRQAITWTLQTPDERADVRLTVELRQVHFLARKRVNLAHQMVVAVV